MNVRRFPRTTREAFGHPGHAIEQHRTGWTLLEVLVAAAVAGGWLALLWWALGLLVGEP